MAFGNGLPTTAAAAAVALGARFAERVQGRARHVLFDAVGYDRRGRSPVGGIFWQGWESLREADLCWWPVPQIVGHTPQPDGYAADFGGAYWCVDAGAPLSGRLSALVGRADGDGWTPVVVGRGA
jgi:hypothetical protein